LHEGAGDFLSDAVGELCNSVGFGWAEFVGKNKQRGDELEPNHGNVQAEKSCLSTVVEEGIAEQHLAVV
jgi:hypothetical protein